MNRRTLVLSLLEDAGSAGVTTGDFLRAGCGSRFGARVQELRDRGYTITSERVRDGSWRYILDQAPATVQAGAPPVLVGPTEIPSGDPGQQLFDLPDPKPRGFGDLEEAA